MAKNVIRDHIFALLDRHRGKLQESFIHGLADNIAFTLRGRDYLHPEHITLLIYPSKPSVYFSHTCVLIVHNFYRDGNDYVCFRASRNGEEVLKTLSIRVARVVRRMVSELDEVEHW